jgi:hypothetical protein
MLASALVTPAAHTYHDQRATNAALPHVRYDHLHQLALAQMIMIVLPGGKNHLQFYITNNVVFS